MTKEEREYMERDLVFRFKGKGSPVLELLRHLTDRELSALSKRTSFVDGVKRESDVTFAEPF